VCQHSGQLGSDLESAPYTAAVYRCKVNPCKLREVPTPLPDEALTITDAARLAGLSPIALRRRVERGTVPSIRRKGKRLVLVDDLKRLGLIDTDAEIPDAEPAPPLTVDDALDRLERLARENGRLRAENEQLRRELDAERTLRGG
jgi:DNA-binding transcriptional MerR regulator